ALLVLPHVPNLARLVAFDAAAPTPFVVMELVEGVDCDVLVETRSLTVPRVTKILAGVLSGLEVMHAKGMGHLDLKPANVVVRSDGEPVLVDFGLAGRRIRPNFLTGAYGAPEVWSGEGAASRPSRPPRPPISPPKADIYSFGCLAYEVM